MTTFVDRGPSLVATAAQIARIQGSDLEATLLEKARASLVQTGYDNWDGGTDLFTLMLEVPIPTYAAIEGQRDALEKAVGQRVSQLTRPAAGNHISEVVIAPVLADAARPVDPPPEDVNEEIPAFWQPGFFRVFISHLAVHKDSAHRLKESLAKFQIAAFVAHDDIEPTREWQTEIERALRTMDAMVAILTPGFAESRWCDQEVGYALGRRKLVIPLRKGADPHGFMAKHQGLQTEGRTAVTVAENLIEILVQDPSSSSRITEALVDRMVTSKSCDASRATLSWLEKSNRLNTSQVARLVQAIDGNARVGKAGGVPERIQMLVKAIGEAVP